MIKLKYLCMASTCAALALASCGDDAFMRGDSDTGRISLRADVNTAVLSSSNSRAFADDGVVTAEDLAVTLTALDGSSCQSWPSLQEFAENSTVPRGNYNLEVYFGSADNEGFECPFYYGSQEVEVKRDEITQVGITATLANSMFTVTYSESLKKYLSDYNVELLSDGAAAPVTYAAAETRPAYLKAGDVEVWLNLTKPNGVSARLLAAQVSAEARHHYSINVDINDGQVGDGSLTVTFDDDLVTEDYEIDLSDELLLKPAPKVYTEGVEAGDEVRALCGMSMNSNVRYVVVARGELDQVKLSTTNTSLFTSAWPEEIDLMKATDAEIAALKALGLEVRGLRGNTGQMAYVEFKEVPNFINLPDDAHTDHVQFTLTAIDRQGKTSDPVSFNLHLSEYIKAQVAGAEDIWANYADITVASNIDGTSYLDQIIVSIAKDGEAYTEVNATLLANGKMRITGLTPGTKYNVMFAHPASVDPEGFTASLSLTTERALQLPNADMETWTITDSNNNWALYYPGSSAAASAWGTNNPMTTSQGANVAYCRISGSIPTSDAHSGSNAALLRTIGWGSGNTASGITSTGVMKYSDAGLLHLGSSRSARPEGASGREGVLTTTDLNCGYAFASRPASMSFWYKYTVKNSADKGYAEIQVIAADGTVITQATANLDAASAYTLKTVTLTYPKNAKKAAKIYVKFLSTNSTSFLSKTNDNFTPPKFGNLSDGTYMGSQLYIDDITLNY